MDNSTAVHQQKEHRRDPVFWVPLAILGILVFGGLLASAYAIGRSSADGGSGEDVQEAVAAQAAKDKRASQAKLKSVRHELRKRFNERRDAAVKEAKQDGYASGKADAEATTVSDGDAGPGYGYVDPSDPGCGGLYDPEGVC